MLRNLRFMSATIALLLATAMGTAAVPLTTTFSGPSPESDVGFREAVLPRLEALTDAVDKVESLVETRSRNIIALQAHSVTIEKLCEQIDTYLASQEYHGEHPEVVEHYRHGKGAVATAIAGARTALQSFDFTSLPDLVPLFSQGSDQLELALTLLESAEAPRSSYTVRQVAIMQSSWRG